MSLFLVSSCGDLFTKKENEISLDQFATCDFDSEAISQILKENIKGELSCLKTNLLFFVDIVESDRPGTLSEKELKTYIRTNLSEQVDEGTLTALGSFFDLSSIIFGDKKGYIQRKNVISLFDLLIEINFHLVDSNIHEYFTTNDRITYLEHNRRKTDIYKALLKVGNALSAKMVDNQNSVNLNTFIDYFTGLGDDELLERAKSVLFIKKAILGGEQNELSFLDLKRLSMIIQDVSKIVYDFANIFDVDVNPEDDEDLINILKEDAETAADKFYFKDKPNEQILTIEELKKVTKVFAPQFEEYFKYEKEILKIKEILFGDNSAIFRAKDLSYFFESILGVNLERSVVIYRAYRENKETIEKVERENDGVIESDFNNITTIGSAQENYKEDFNRIVRNYRIFKGSKNVPLVDYKYERNVRSVVEIAFFEDIVNRVFKQYGELKKESTSHYTLSLEQMNALLGDFSELIYDMGWVYPGRLSNTADTVTLMTSLFHFQSNGDSRVEVAEMVEFIITMLSSLDLSDTLFENIAKYCDISDKGTYDVQCFRDNFRATIRDYKANDQTIGTIAEALPILDTYLNSLSERDYQAYMHRTAKFSRTCTTFPKDGIEVPMDKGDGLVTWAGLLAIEQTLLKYDENKDNILTPSELDNLYVVFKPALDAMIPVDFLKKHSKKIFKYIIKFQRIPDFSNIKGVKTFAQAVKQGGHFMWHTFNPFTNKDADADRMTFAAVLQIIAENTPVEGEPFDCELLRN